MSRYLYKKIQNISPEWLNFQHSGLKLTTLGSDPMKTKLLNKEEIKTKMMELTYIQERLAEE